MSLTILWTPPFSLEVWRLGAKAQKNRAANASKRLEVAWRFARLPAMDQ